MLRFVALVAIVTVCLTVTSAYATDINGSVVATKKFTDYLAKKEEESRTPRIKGYWNEPNTQRMIAPPRVDPSKDLGVVLIREGAPPPKADNAVIVKVHAGEMDKNVIVVRPGSTVKFQHDSPYSHELYSPGHDRFLPEGQSGNGFRPIEFSKEGVFEVRCKLVPHFRGWVIVTQATELISLDRKGSFSLADKEPGKYKIKVFHGGRWVHEQSFEVPNRREFAVAVKLKEPKVGGDKPAKDKETKETDAKAGAEKKDVAEKKSESAKPASN